MEFQRRANAAIIEAFAALAQESRLSIFRMLVKEEPHGLPVGEISRRLNIVPSTLSGHLGVLKRAGLLKSTRHQREIHYATDLEAMSDLVRFVLEDCCSGQVGHCSEIVSLLNSG
ncbi:metalloregulator ArsR/SmtB family transcription factor [Gammaproteobacteria bacterium]|nr:metalloregulator ArsR/SmtB family transcription factor [Gammaproteobacteria bacterium]